MLFNEPGGAFTNFVNIEDGAVIDTTGFVLTNSDSGRIIGGVTFLQGGNTVVNQLGGIIRGTDPNQAFSQVLVTGSAGADVFINAGRVNGLVSLGAGNDIYVENDGLTNGRVQFGSGDDTYRVEGSSWRFLNANGGDGWDRLVMANTNYQIWGDQLVEFEELVLEQDGNIQNFSGYQSIILAGTDRFNFYNFLDSLNPLVDLNLNGQAVALRRSSVQSVTGTEGNDTLELGQDAAIGGNVLLGGGVDSLRLWGLNNTQGLNVGGTINGGAGRDSIEIFNSTTGSGPVDVSYDLTKFSNFEQLLVNAYYGGYQLTARVSNAVGIDDIRVGTTTTLILSASQLPTANVTGAAGGRIEIQANAVIGQYGGSLGGPFMPWQDLPQADDTQSVSLINRGSIVGDARFGIGDDLYDGSSGTIGGTVYGSGGNDRFLGGAGNERFEGGHGADYLSGGAGNDVLLGGFGRDTMLGGTGNDIYEVDNAADIVFEAAGEGSTDNVFAYTDFTLPTHVENLIMFYGSQRFGTGNAGDNIIIGNSSANVLEGGAGYDTLSGGAGSDLFVVRPGWGVDVVTDFRAGAGSQDAILFASSLFTSFAQVMANSAQVGNDTWIGDGNGNTLVLTGVARASLHPDDFGFI